MARARRAQDALGTYRDKRRFNETPEPRGRAGNQPGHLYTIQKHAARRLHYDLRLELDGVLKSWAVTKGPSLDPSDKRLAVRTEDHPIDYAKFEGRIPEGNYGAGTVLLWDQGEWEPIGDPHEGLEHGKLVFRLRGERLKGRWALIRFHGQRDPKRENWLLIKEKDDVAAHDGEVTEQATCSVASGREMDAIAAAPDATWQGKAAKTTTKRSARHSGNLPAFSPPALATLVDHLPQGKEWLFEIKFDGYRALTAASGDQVRIYTRSGLDWTERYPGIARAVAALDLDRALLDGEVVALDKEGRSDFGALQQALSNGGKGLNYFIFDLLAYAGEDWRNQPLRARKEKLRELLAEQPRDGPLAYTDHVSGDGREMYETLCAKSFEGVIAKRADAKYVAGRGTTWLKIKCSHAQEFVIVGWKESDKDRPFSSILLAQHQDGALRYAGHAGSGFSAADLSALAKRFAALALRSSPLQEKLPRAVTQGAHWLKPELVAEIAFAEFTGDGIVRQGRFLGLRQDKSAKAVTQETAMPLRSAVTNGDDEARVGGVRLTHPDKLLYPAEKLTKRDVALYLHAASERMLAHLANRPLSLLRCPDGQAAQCFFQRHVGPGFPAAIKRLPMKDKRGKDVEYISISDEAGLLSAVQADALEFHIWGAHVDDLQHPDRIVFDLDPDLSVKFPRVREAAEHLRAALDAMGLASFAMLSGGKGVHVVVPIQPRHSWEVIKEFAGALAGRFAEQAPELYVATMRKAKRTGRIFIDYFRNDWTASAICAYSPRAREGAAVAWPVTWDELTKVASADAMKLGDATRRLAEPDPWKDYAKTKQSLTAAALRALGVKA